MTETHSRPTQRGLLLPLNPEVVASEPHLVSVCARYSPSQRLSWSSAPARLISLHKPSLLSKTEAFVSDEGRGTRQTDGRSVSDGCSSAAPFNWRPVAITLTLFTLANLVLLGMSCYLYSRAKKVGFGFSLSFRCE